MSTTALRRFSFQAMGSFCEIQLLDKSRIDARQTVRQLIAEVARLERKFSRYLPDSLISSINNGAGQDAGVAIDIETRALLDHAQRCFEQSEGLFDITTGILRRVWDFKNSRVPTQQQIDTLLPLIGQQCLRFSEDRIFLPEGMEIDLGGIVKEYATDSVAALARKLGVATGLVNLGGDFSVIGPLPGEDPWPVGIVDPTNRGALMARLLLRHGGLASSGDYERCFIYQGQRYSHILNPRTGWPCSGLRAVSVCAELCTVAGSAATIAMLKPEPNAIAWLAELGLPHVFMRQDGTIGGDGLAD